MQALIEHKQHRVNFSSRGVLVAGLAMLVWLFSLPAQAGVEMESVSRGTLFFKAAHDGKLYPAPQLNTDVAMRITGFINRAKLTQTFSNTRGDWVEGVYVFPLPENAVVDHLRLVVGERIIEGQIKPRQKARKIYEQAKRQGKRTSLLEQQRPNMFTTSVANIGPGEQVRVEIEFQQTLRYDQGRFSLRFPLAITPRYIPGHAHSTSATSVNGWSAATDQVADAHLITPLVTTGKTHNPVRIHVELEAGFDLQSLQSPYHNIVKQLHGEGRYSIHLAEGEVPADRDFELVWEPVHGQAPTAAIFREAVKDDNYYLVMMLPPEPEAETKQALAREVIYVIDTSGSMSGVSIRQARKALGLALQHLRSGDTFNVIQFNSVTSSLFTSPQPASFANVTRAKGYVASLAATGGTEMLPAMRMALKRQDDSARLRQVIFLTDGAIGNEDALFKTIRYQLGNSRLFTVGIGSAPNSHFMNKAAQFGRGTFTYISQVNEVAEKMQELFTKLDTPVMRDLKLVEHLGDVQVWPEVLPDLYAREPLIFTARTSATMGEVGLLGQRQANPWQVSFFLQDALPGQGIGKLWARNHIEALLDSVHDGADADQVRDEVIALAMRHHLVSKHTSLVAVDTTPVRPAEAALKSRAVPTNLPHGQDAGQIFGLNAQTGTAQYVWLSLGSLLLLIAMGLFMLRRWGNPAWFA